MNPASWHEDALTEVELEIIADLASAWTKLSRIAGFEAPHLVGHIHALQDFVLARGTRRMMSDLFGEP